VHDHLNALFAENADHHRLVTEIGLMKGNAKRHRRTVPENEIVYHDRFVTGGMEKASQMTANVSGTAGNEDSHGKVTESRNP